MFDFLSKQFIDVIEWTDEPGVLAIRYPMQDREIQNGAQLTVREGQMAAFINEGRVADVFGPGLHTLETQNLPLLTSLMNWDKAFKSPFKSDVYFFSQREQLNCKWGTQQPITIRDKEFGPHPHAGVRQLFVPHRGCRTVRAQADGHARADAPRGCRAATARRHRHRARDRPRRRHHPVPRPCRQPDRHVRGAEGGGGAGLRQLGPHHHVLLRREPVAAGRGAAASRQGQLDANDRGSRQYAKFQTAEAIEAAASQPGGAAGAGVGMGAGLAMGQAMAAGFGGGGGGGSSGGGQADDPYAAIERLHKLVTAGAISQEEFDAKKAELLSRIR